MQVALQFPPELLLKAQGVRVAFLDVDGVMTDGGLYFSASGETVKRFHVLDGYGIRLLHKSGIVPVVITGRDAKALRVRLQALGVVDAYFGVDDKHAAAQASLHKLGLRWDQAAVMGDDWPDLPLVRQCGFSAAPPNAHEEVLAAVDFVTHRPGGQGAVRCFCDLLLTAAGKYAQLLEDARVIKFLLTAWDRLSIYLPIALMGLMALGTYWLVQNSPNVDAPVSQRPVRHEPDYFMKNFSVTSLVESGRLKSEVFGTAARHFPDSDTLEIDRIRIRSFDEQGRLTTATADRALTNNDASVVELFGNALMVREATRDKSGNPVARIEFRGEYLHANTDTEHIKSNKPVELRRGNDVFVADSMDFDNVQQVMVMQGRVRGLIMPARTK